jgi:hypothetical protein
MFRSIVASAAVVALAAGATAQNQLPAGSLNKTVTPSAGVYSMETGFEVTTQAYRSGPEVLFNNRAGLGYYYTTVLDTDEYVDEGAFAQRGVNGTEQVNGMTWEYCSGIPDSVGDALSVEVRFYNDTILGSGPTGWTNTTAERGAACAFGIAGLPGDTALTGLSCWIITLDLAGGFECTLPQETTLGGQEPFGMSVVYLDATGSTGPILDSITGGAAPGYGAQDYFEWFDTSQPAGAEYQGAFFFGGGAKLQGSFNMELAGNVNDTEAYYSAAPLAGDTVDWQATAEVRAGSAAGWAVTNPDGVSNYGMLVSNGSADLPVVAGGTASLLVNAGGLLTSPIPLGTSGAFGINLPGSVPSSIFTQAVQHTGALTPPNTTAASNGLVHSN